MIPLENIAAQLRNGKSVRQSEDAGGLPITRIETIAEGVINGERVGFAGLEEGDCIEWLLEEGDILISHINSTKHLGKCAIYAGEPPILVHGMNLLGLRVKQEAALPRYVYRMMTSPGFRQQIPRITKHSVNQSSFNISNFKKLEIPLPPLSEQRRIAGILDAADALRAKRREALAQLDTLLQSTFLDMFGDPVTNPMGWEVLGGDTVFSDLTYGTSRKASELPSSRSLPVLRIPNVIGGQVDWTDLKFAEPTTRERQKVALKMSDLLFVRTNGNPDYIGRCARFDGSREALFASYLIRGRVRESTELESEFLKHLIEYPTYRHEVRREARTTAGNFNLSTAGIRKFKFIKPPLELQRSFVAIVESVERQKARMRAHLTELDALFASLQSRAFSGTL